MIVYNGLSEGKMTPSGQRFTVLVWKIENPPTPFGRNVPLKPSLAGGAKGHYMNEISSSGSPAFWAGSLTERGVGVICFTPLQASL